TPLVVKSVSYRLKTFLRQVLTQQGFNTSIRECLTVIVTSWNWRWFLTMNQLSVAFMTSIFITASRCAHKMNLRYGDCLCVSDIDSTMIGQECIDELGDFAGLKEKIAAITERAMQGELDFESALRERVGLLANLAEGAIATCLEERIAPMPGARTLVGTLK